MLQACSQHASRVLCQMDKTFIFPLQGLKLLTKLYVFFALPICPQESCFVHVCAVMKGLIQVNPVIRSANNTLACSYAACGISILFMFRIGLFLQFTHKS